MKQSLGLIEVSGLALAIMVSDVMAKVASIQLLDIEKTKGSGWMVVKIAGDVASVEAAVMTGAEFARQRNGLIASRVIARPINDLDLMLIQQKKPEKMLVANKPTVDTPLSKPRQEAKPKVEAKPKAVNKNSVKNAAAKSVKAPQIKKTQPKPTLNPVVPVKVSVAEKAQPPVKTGQTAATKQAAVTKQNVEAKPIVKPTGKQESKPVSAPPSPATATTTANKTLPANSPTAGKNGNKKTT